MTVPLRVVLIPGDGVGPEITAAARRVLDATGVRLEWIVEEVGQAAYAGGGDALPQRVLDAIRACGLALKGPVAAPVGAPFASVNVALRQALGLHTGIRPCKSPPRPAQAEAGLDVVIVRMNVEDLYAGIEFGPQTTGMKRLRDVVRDTARHELPADSAVALKPLSPAGCSRAARAAFDYAAAHGRRKVTAVHKANVMPQTDGLFLACVRRVAREHPAIELEDRLVDTACAELVMRPERYDVIVAPMLYGDVLSDLAAALAGGLGLAPGANLGGTCAVFEAVHGTARRLAGRGVANPSALILSGAMLLRQAGERTAAERVEHAVQAVIADGTHVTYDLTPARDPAAAAGTSEMADAVIARLGGQTEP
jgi:isocitrate dehydrogenase (NAD+)